MYVSVISQNCGNHIRIPIEDSSEIVFSGSRVLSAGKTYPRFFYLAFGAVHGKAFVETHFVLPRIKFIFRTYFNTSPRHL